jgi:sulfur-oxidizing protein SoxY
MNSFADLVSVAIAGQATRRNLLRRGGWLAGLMSATCLPTREVLVDLPPTETGFEATSLSAALRSLGGIPSPSSDIVLTVPELVENGAVVPVTVLSRLPNTQEIAIVVELNPNPLIARFTIPSGTDAFVSTRVKLAQSGNVYAVVRANGLLYAAFKDAVVTLGACSGS